MSAHERRDEVLRERADRLAATDNRVETQAIAMQVAVVVVGSERIGIPSHGLREITPLPPLTRLPELPPWVLGVAHARGELVSVLDTAKLLEISSATAPGYLVLLRSPEGMLGLTAEAVQGFRPVYQNELGQSARAENASRRPIAAVTHDLVSILDLDRLLRSEMVLVG